MSWPRKTPIKLRRVGSSMISEGFTVPVPSAHKPSTATPVATSVHMVERTDQSLVHSAAMARRRPTRPGGSSMAKGVGAPSTAVTIHPGTRRLRRSAP